MSTASYIIAVSEGLFNVVFLLKKVVKFYARFTKVIVVIMPVQSPWWLRLFVMVSIG